MSTPKVAVRFSTVADLWKFKLAIHALVIKIDTDSLILICDCCDEHVELATREFNAIEVQTINDSS